VARLILTHSRHQLAGINEIFDFFHEDGLPVFEFWPSWSLAMSGSKKLDPW
jgi:hypothetical protein